MAAWQIPLSGKPSTEAVDPQTIQQRQLTLQQMAQGVAQQKVMGPLQVTAAQQENQQRGLGLQQTQMDLEDQQKMRKAWMDSGGDLDKMMSLAPTYGVGPKTLMAANQSITAMKEARAKLTAADLDNQAKKNDGLNGLLQPVVAETDPARQAALWNQQMGEALKKGFVTPEEVGQHPYPGSPDAVKAYQTGLMTEKWMTAQGSAQRGQAAADNAALGKAKWKIEEPGFQAKANVESRQNIAAELSTAPSPQAYNQILTREGVDHGFFPAAETVFDTSGKPIPDMMAKVQQMGMTPAQQVSTAGEAEARKQATVPKTADELQIALNNPNLSPEQRAAYQASLQSIIATHVAERPVNTTNITVPGVSATPPADLHGEDYAKTLPASFAARVRAVFRGDEPLPSGQAANRGQNAQLVQAVYQYDPEFSTLLAQGRKEALKELNSTSNSKVGGQRLALNTLIHHADLYLDTAKALNNGTFVPGNAVYNAVATAFGKAPPTQANLVARFFAGETGKVATGGVPAEGEINGILQNMSSNASPEQIQAAGQKLLQIASGRMIPIKEYVAKNHLDKFVDVIGPDAKRILAKRGFDPETMEPVAAAPALPVALSATDVGKTFTNKSGQRVKVTEINPQNPKQFKFEVVNQ